jgi:hypothetical protein
MKEKAQFLSIIQIYLKFKNSALLHYLIVEIPLKKVVTLKFKKRHVKLLNNLIMEMVNKN